MQILRTIGAVVGGYLLYAIGSMLAISALIGREGLLFAALALAALVVIGLGAGWLVSFVAGGTRRVAGFVTAGLVTLATAANLLLQLGAEPIWYKVGTLALTVPSLLFVVLSGETDHR